jgi:hypothetical protein
VSKYVGLLGSAITVIQSSEYMRFSGARNRNPTKRNERKVKGNTSCRDGVIYVPLLLTWIDTVTVIHMG